MKKIDFSSGMPVSRRFSWILTTLFVAGFTAVFWLSLYQVGEQEIVAPVYTDCCALPLPMEPPVPLE